MREQLPLISLGIAVLAFLVAIYPPGTFFGARRFSPQVRSLLDSQTLNSTPLNGVPLTQDIRITKLQNEVRSLSKKMDRMSGDYDALSEWTMEQLVAIEASKHGSEWDSSTDDGSSDSVSEDDGNSDSIALDSEGQYSAASDGSRYLSYGDDSTDFGGKQPRVQTGRYPMRGRGNWQENQFQKTLSALSLFPQQVAPVTELFDDSMAKTTLKISELKQSGDLTTESIAQVREEVLSELEYELLSILTADQMEAFRSLYNRKNRYDTDSGSSGSPQPGGADNSSVVNVVGSGGVVGGVGTNAVDSSSTNQTVVTTQQD